MPGGSELGVGSPNRIHSGHEEGAPRSRADACESNDANI